jgi:hypothetical protein
MSLPLPLVLLRKRRDESTDAMNAALMATDSESATTTTSSLSKRKTAKVERSIASTSYFLKRLPSSKHTITVFVVLREQQARGERYPGRLTHAALNALISRRELVVSVRVRQRPTCDTLSIKRSVCIDYIDSVVQLDIDFAPPLSVILPPNQQQVGIFVTLGGVELRGGYANGEHVYPHELARFDRFEGVSPAKKRPSVATDSNAVAAAVAAAAAASGTSAGAKAATKKARRGTTDD